MKRILKDILIKEVVPSISNMLNLDEHDHSNKTELGRFFFYGHIHKDKEVLVDSIESVNKEHFHHSTITLLLGGTGEKISLL